MNLALPALGSIIRYSYLWADEQAHSQEEGRKHRPALVFALSVQHHDRKVQVLVLAITRRPPRDPQDAVPLPMRIGRNVGLDVDASWIVTTEANAFAWPGPDLGAIPGRKPPTVVYGRVPGALLKQVAQSVLANRRRQRTRIVRRSS